MLKTHMVLYIGTSLVLNKHMKPYPRLVLIKQSLKKRRNSGIAECWDLRFPTLQFMAGFKRPYIVNYKTVNVFNASLLPYNCTVSV